MEKKINLIVKDKDKNLRVDVFINKKQRQPSPRLVSVVPYLAPNCWMWRSISQQKTAIEYEFRFYIAGSYVEAQGCGRL